VLSQNGVVPVVANRCCCCATPDSKRPPAPLHAGADASDLGSLVKTAIRSSGRPLTPPLPPPERGGLLLLSEFATASHVLSACMRINPWHIPGVSDALDQAIQLDDGEVARRQARDLVRIGGVPLREWGEAVLVDLLESRDQKVHQKTQMVVHHSRWGFVGCRLGMVVLVGVVLLHHPVGLMLAGVVCPLCYLLLFPPLFVRLIAACLWVLSVVATLPRCAICTTAGSRWVRKKPHPWPL